MDSGGLGRNRTTDTRIFNPAREAIQSLPKSKKRNGFSRLAGAGRVLLRTGLRTALNLPPASPYVFCNGINAIAIPATNPSLRTHVPVKDAAQAALRLPRAAALSCPYAASSCWRGTITEPAFAASCKVFDDRWAYRIVTFGSECPRIC